MDLLVATKIMGWKKKGAIWYDRGKYPYELYPAPFSRDIEWAWRVVEKLLTLNSGKDIHIEKMKGTGWKIGTCFHKNEGGWDNWVEAATFPHAVCLAALRTVGYELPE